MNTPWLPYPSATPGARLYLLSFLGKVLLFTLALSLGGCLLFPHSSSGQWL